MSDSLHDIMSANIGFTQLTCANAAIMQNVFKLPTLDSIVSTSFHSHLQFSESAMRTERTKLEKEMKN